MTDDGRYLDDTFVRLLDSRYEATSIALYGQVDWRPLPGTTIAAGLRVEERAVDALEQRPVFTAAPVGAGDGHQLELGDLAGLLNLGAVVEVDFRREAEAALGVPFGGAVGCPARAGASPAPTAGGSSQRPTMRSTAI